MPKKFTTILTLCMLAVGILAKLAPIATAVQYDGVLGAGEYYTIPELNPTRQQFINDIKLECGAPSTNGSYTQCYINVMIRYKSRKTAISDLVTLMGDSNGTATLTGINPAADSLRFYVDTLGSSSTKSYEYENFYIFWLDDTAAAGTNTTAIREYIPNLVAGDIPQGVHLLYSSKRGQDDWFTINAEQRVEYASTGDVFNNNKNQCFYLSGYDTAGELHFYTTNFTKCAQQGYDYDSGNECLAQYYYNTENSTYSLVCSQAPAAAEDLARIQLKKLERAVSEAAELVRQAEEAAKAARELADIAKAAAEAAATEAQAATERAEAAENQIAEAKDRALEAEQQATAAKERATEAERQAAEAENRALEAVKQAAEADQRAAAAENAASSAASAAIDADKRATEAENRAADAEHRALEAENHAAATERQASEANQRAAEAEELARLADQAARASESIASEAADLAAAIARQSNATSASLESALEAFTSLDDSIAAIRQELSRLFTELAVATASQSTTSIIITESMSANSTTPTPDCPQSLSDKAITPPTTSDDVDAVSATNCPWWLLGIILPGLVILIWWFIFPVRQKRQDDGRE